MRILSIVTIRLTHQTDYDSLPRNRRGIFCIKLCVAELWQTRPISLQQVKHKNCENMNFLQKLSTDGETSLTVTDIFKMIADYGRQTGETLGNEISDIIDELFD